MPSPLLVTFVAGDEGPWRIDRVEPYRGDTLPDAQRLAVVPGHHLSPAAGWSIRASTGHVRYVERGERVSLEARQPPLGRPDATLASLIPIRKSDAWWDLTQEERRAIFEDRSQHIAASLPYLPAVARRLHHCRELGESFDFVTWFEYAPEDAARF